MDDRIDDLLRDEASGYHEPPATPRDAMWQRIQMARAEAARAEAMPVAAVAPRAGRRWGRIGLGIAAVLALGIGIGRWMERSPATAAPGIATAPSPAAPASRDSSIVTAPERMAVPSAQLATSPQRSPRPGTPTLSVAAPGRPAGSAGIAYNVALDQHLGQSEAFLTLFRSSVRAGHVEPVAFATARHLLSTNRLLIDSRAGAAPQTRQLLQDLELVLAGIAQLGSASDSSDVHLVTEDMDQGDVLPRLRTAVPAGI